MAKARPVVAKPKPKKPEPSLKVVPRQPDTEASLIAAMRELLEEVDRGLKAGNEVWRAPDLIRKRGDLFERMDRLFPDGADVPAQHMFANALAVKAETNGLTWPSRFVEWVGYVPVLVDWLGWLGEAALCAADPNEMWLNSTGYVWLPYYIKEAGSSAPRTWVKHVLRDRLKDPKFRLLALDNDARENAAERLAANEWLHLALKIGPVDPLPLPKRLQAVQQPLF